jgi:hypothetical protein
LATLWGHRTMTHFILATGPSMSQDIANAVKGRGVTIAVSDAYRLAPWAEYVVSSDAQWWRKHPEAIGAIGQKFGAMPDFQAIPGVDRLLVPTGSNSGLLALHVAVRFGAKRIVLLGFDMKGDTHFFGKHPFPLKTTSPERYEVFKRQFGQYHPKGVEIINATPGSALQCYPFQPLGELIC